MINPVEPIEAETVTVYPPPMPKEYVEEASATHDPFDIYLHGY